MLKQIKRSVHIVKLRLCKQQRNLMRSYIFTYSQNYPSLFIPHCIFRVFKQYTMKGQYEICPLQAQ